MPNEQIPAFLRLKTSLSDVLMLDTLKAAINKPIRINQLEGYHRQPLAFFSKTVQPPELRYSTFERALLLAC